MLGTWPLQGGSDRLDSLLYDYDGEWHETWPEEGQHFPMITLAKPRPFFGWSNPDHPG
jgi:hypothetical protein